MGFIKQVCPHCGHVTFVDDKRRADVAIEYYYRAKSQGARRMTLAKVGEKFGYSPDYLRKVKIAYDRAGKWGAKHKKAQP